MIQYATTVSKGVRTEPTSHNVIVAETAKDTLSQKQQAVCKAHRELQKSFETSSPIQ